MDTEYEAGDKCIQELNAQRQASQMDVAPKLHAMTRKWYDLVQKNNNIEAACSALESRKRPKR
jgi:hypothetical protein